MSQLDLFAADPDHAPKPARPAVGAADTSRLRELADGLPEALRMGTSSWSFPGWASIVYDGAFTQQRLAREGLDAYAQHPLFRAVGLDRTHYAPVTADVLADYAGRVPSGFRFVVKAHEACTLARFPPHRRYGDNRDQPNRLFLDASYAVDAVVAPAIEGLSDTLGVLLFQFAPQPLERLGGPRGFADRLHRFLFRLPSGPLYAVEIRNRGLLTPRYADALADVGACHCVSSIRGMPDPATQWRVVSRPGPPRALVARWMLPPHLTYEQARERYAPFDALVEEDPGARQQFAALVREVCDLGLPAYVVVNNKAEGSAPLSIERLAREIVATR